MLRRSDLFAPWLAAILGLAGFAVPAPGQTAEEETTEENTEEIAEEIISEEIVVSAGRPVGSLAPDGAAVTLVDAGDSAAPPTSFAELASTATAVSENGQGGRFQVLSIRGVSRLRVLTLVSGMSLTTERRAGVSASFIDPLLIGPVDVVRGPASSFYGSGALGGVMQIFPKSFGGSRVDLGYTSQGDQSVLGLGWGQVRGTGRWDLGLVRRQGEDEETPAGERLNSAFEQYSGLLRRTWAQGDKTWEVLAIPAYASDIGKSSSDFPEGGTTVYPEERHLLMKVGLREADRWSFHVYAHPNDLITADLEPDGSRARVVNEAFNFGAAWQAKRSLESQVQARYGLDYFGRRAVDATESRFSAASAGLFPGGAQPIEVLRTLDGGQQDDLGAFGALSRDWQHLRLEAGARLAWQRQENRGTPSETDSALTGFLGAVVPLSHGWELVANAGTGLRFPSLSERFFTGTTGRGGVIGNPDLAPERSLSGDLGARWYRSNLFLGAYLFRNEIDDYIERVRVSEDLRTFVNLTSGTIEGLEVEGTWLPAKTWKVRFGGHLMNGESAAGGDLADIPPARLLLGLEKNLGPWSLRGNWQHRFEKDDPGSGENVISGVDLVSSSASYEFETGLLLTLSGTNLLDETYFASADDRAPVAPGRSVGLSLSWRSF